MSRAETTRAFFALLPDEAARRGLQAILSRLPPRAGRPVAASNLHLTLVFVGPCDTARLACLHAQAGTVSISPLTIQLDRLGLFGRGRVLWAGSEQADEGLCDLVSRLGEVLTPCGHQPERHRPFQAHVTLSRAAREFPEALEVKPIIWQASEFALMASRQTPSGVRYDVLARYPRDAGMPLSAGASVG